MKKNEFEKAEPFAEAAADSWAAWAMEAAIECEEGLGHWEQAEGWVKREQQRYGPATRWLRWCERTGHGDLEAARSAAGR